MTPTRELPADSSASDIAWLQEALGASPLRVLIIRFAATAGGPFTARMVIESVGGSRSTVGAHLQALTAAGILQRDHRLQERTGRGSEVEWTWQTGALSEGLRRVLAHFDVGI